MKKLLFSTLLALTILFIYRGPVWAKDEAMQISPAIEEISISPGTPTSYQLTITNTADIPLGLHADVTTFQTPDEGHEDVLTPSPLITWTKVDPIDTIIDAHQQQSLTVTITPPKDLKTGGYYAGVFLTPFITKAKIPNTPIVLTRVGTLLLAQYGTTDYSHLKEKAKITDFSFTKPVFEQSPFSFNFTVRNAYFTHFTGKPFLTLTPLFGKSQRVQFEEKHILPGKSKVWAEQITPQKTALLYKATLAVSVGGGNYISKDTYVVMIPGLHYILIAIILLFLLLVATYHKRMTKALVILLRG